MDVPKMAVLNLQQYPPSPPPAASRRIIAFTTPQNYAGRFSDLIQLRSWVPLWCPTLSVEPTPGSISTHSLPSFSAIAFTSRTGIAAVAQALAPLATPPLPAHGDIFTLSALGNDSELLDASFIARLCENPERIRVLIPPVATPSGLAAALGLGHGRKIFCPVPAVIGLEEPPVVPEFLADLDGRGWVAVRVKAYETRWRSGAAEQLVEMMEEECGGVDAIVFTSSAEVEGLLKSLEEVGLNWGVVRRMCPKMVAAAAHRPVMAAGAERLGVDIDVVSSRFDSFDGVVDELHCTWNSLPS